MGRDHDPVAGPVDRQHGFAGDFQRIACLVIKAGEDHFLPAGAHRKAGIIKKAFITRLRHANQRYRASCNRVGSEARKLGKADLGRVQRLGKAFGGGPARLAV